MFHPDGGALRYSLAAALIGASALTAAALPQAPSSIIICAALAALGVPGTLMAAEYVALVTGDVLRAMGVSAFLAFAWTLVTWAAAT